MHPTEILKHIRRKPFHPFRVFISDGATFDVQHPEMIAVSRHDVAIAYHSNGDEVPEEMTFCDPVHITRIEPIDQKRTPKQRRPRS